MPDSIEIAALAKNANEALIMAVLARGECHGYQIALEIEELSNEAFFFNHGTLYPILHKLEKDGLIRGEWKKEKTKRKRKYYSLSTKGRQQFVSMKARWQEFFERFFKVIGNG